MKRSTIRISYMTLWASILASILAVGAAAEPVAAGATNLQTTGRQFHPLVPLRTVRIVAASEAFPGGRFEASNLLDGWGHSEYSSASRGTETFIDFDLGKPTLVAGFRHLDRRDPATVDTAELVFSNTADFAHVIAAVEINHVGTSGGLTFVALPSAITARYVRWRVTALGPKGHGTVGGAEIGFFTAEAPDPAPVRDRLEPRGLPALIEREGKLFQPIEVTVHHNYAESTEATLRIGSLDPVPVELRLGSRTVQTLLPAVDRETPLQIVLAVDGRPAVRSRMKQEPVRHWELYFLPHSHVDIGYTHLQTEVEAAHWKYFEQAIEIAKNTADYPPEARYKWNTEVMWAVDSYLKQATQEKKAAFIDAVKKGWIHLDALYGSELTALCRPEELMRLTDCARRVSEAYDLPIDTAMISDVPGYTWGIVPALAAGGVKYFSIGPNHVHRIGYTLADWGDRPFYWVSPSGQDKVLCWMAGKAYSWFHGSRVGTVTVDTPPEPFFDYLQELAQKRYPYDMVQLRYSIGGDNGPPDAQLSEFVKAFNEKYTWPRMAITTTSELMREFERRYGDRLPEIRGDMTPYWEDGAGSSANETAMSRGAAERLVQAETLWAMLAPGGYPDEKFYAAWRNVMLYDEHTWGAHCSISRPDDPFTLSQWKIKQAYAIDAVRQSEELVRAVLAPRKSSSHTVRAVDVYNTTSWPRTDLITLEGEFATAGHVVKDSQGNAVPSQRAASLQGKAPLLFLAKDVPPMSAKRFFIEPGQPAASGNIKVEGNSISNGRVRVVVDKTTGAIESLTCDGIDVDLVDDTAGLGLNDYFYVAGRDPKEPKRNGAVRIEPGDTGPLTGSLLVYSDDVPGCRRLLRIVRLIDGIDRIDLINSVEKEKVREKESVHFGFAFNVPEGVMRMDMPWSVVRPEVDQLPGANKNYFTVGRWIDVSNDRFGVTWATVDAPLVELGRITMDVLPTPFEPRHWIRKLEPTQTLYSYVMNNYWETNYKASQEGTMTFSYSIRPHRKFDQAAAARFGVEQSQPLIVVPVDPETPTVDSLFRVEPKSVMVTSVKPSLDGKTLSIRLFNAGDQPAAARVIWSDPQPKRMTSSIPDGQLPPLGIATVAVELTP